jgi:glycosyltransferase involved in cell wall biosynthesis
VSPPLVSIVTPSYNQADFLEETIRSVLDQDYEPIEYVVVDGGSTDGSAEIIRRHEDRLSWSVSEPDAGQAQAINKGFDHTRGTLMGYLNSDDTLLPGAISRLVAALEEGPELVAAYGDAVWLDEEGRATGYAESRSWELVPMISSGSGRIHQPSSLWRRSAWDEVGGLEESLHYTFDTLFFIRLATVGPARHLQEPLSGYRLHPSSKTYTEPPPKLEEYVRLADDYLTPDRLPVRLRKHSRRARASYYRRAALGWYNAGDLRRARRLFLRSLQLFPRMSRRTARHLAPTLLPGPVIRLRRALRTRPPT